MTQIIFAILAVSVFSFFFYSLRRRCLQLITIGQGVEEPRFDHLFMRLKDVFVEGLLQKRMYTDFGAALMHLIIFWGFFTVSLGTLETLLSGVVPSLTFRNLLGSDHGLYKAYVSSQEWTNAAVALAIMFAVVRRLFFPPKRFSSLTKHSRVDAYIVLGLIGGLVTTALLYMGAESLSLGHENDTLVFASSLVQGLFFWIHDVSWVTVSTGLWWLHVAILFGFTSFLPYSKHQHLIWVWPNIFFKSHKGTGRLRPMKFSEDAESFGVGTAQGFTWKQLLDGMACVECGRCTAVCPANVTGKDLNPRLIINQIKESMLDAVKNPEDKRKKLVGDLITPEELWACTTCGACMEACPLHIEHIPAIIDMRRYMTMTEGNVPAELQTTLQNLESQSNPWGFNNQKRAEWAQGLGVKTMEETKGDVDYLFWVGCAGSFDERYKKVSRSIAGLLNEAKVNFAILGTEEKCNGDTARRAGNEYLADMQIRENIEVFKKYNVKKVVTGCPHCFNTIKNEYPDFGFKTEVIHHSELLSQLVEQKMIVPKQGTVESLTYHDSCYLGRHNKIYEEPRKALASSSKEGHVREMPRNKEKGFCCGAGGARMWMEETKGERVNVNRAQEAVESGAKTIATACPFCMTMMRDGVAAHKKEKEIEVLDIAELMYGA
jgi:Fe-S oxidoreductase